MNNELVANIARIRSTVLRDQWQSEGEPSATGKTWWEESVKILPARSEEQHDPITYGDVTAQAVALPEITASRRRTFCMPVSTKSDTPGNPGQPTLWSATIDALAVGASVVRNGDELRLLDAPDPRAARLLVVSAGNVDPPWATDHVALSDTCPVRDPGQAWNALTIGAYTELNGARAHHPCSRVDPSNARRICCRPKPKPGSAAAHPSQVRVGRTHRGARSLLV